MKRVWAIAKLTFQEGLRMRVVLVLLIILGIAMLRLPFALKGDETLSGRLQTFLAYSLGAMSVFLGLATAFLSCATLTGEIRSRSLHLVLAKPVTRFQVLAGKWLGVNLLNLLLVIAAGGVIFGFALYIKSQPELFTRDTLQLRDVIWTARVAAHPTLPDFLNDATEYVDGRMKRDPTFTTNRDAAIQENVKQREAGFRLIPPGEPREYVFENLTQPDAPETVLQVRFKARGTPIPRDDILFIDWVLVDPETGELVEAFRTEKRQAERHQFLFRAGGRLVQKGRAIIGVVNPLDPMDPRSMTQISFEAEDSLELLYKVGSFEWNYVKTLTLILFRLAFISAVGLFFGTFTSFPVACFCTLSIYLFCLGIPWWMESIGANLPPTAISAKVDPYGSFGPIVRTLLVPVLRFALPDFWQYDGIARLIDGYYISPATLAWSTLHTLVYGLALLAIPGWLIFQSREVAEVVA
ncbi:MAG: ABC transporter permease [Planctomycetes bacterium]|nr:ABC transporter permease [Planctomycetota bacterium]